MMQRLFRITVILIGIIVTAGYSSCRDDEPVVEYITDSEHTLLIYMVGDDSSMSKLVPDNMKKILEGIKQSDHPLNVVIYHDNRSYQDDLPVLFQLKKRVNSSKIDTVYLKKWKNDLDSTDPGFMASVAELTFKTFNTPIKGFEYWGHGLSWIPSNKFQIPDSTGTRAMEYIGVDNGNKSDIWEMAEALENTGIHFDYMLFDACNMATAEVAYELRHTTDYILAAPTEIQIEGFPYRTVIQALSTITCEENIVEGLSNAFEAFETRYDGQNCNHSEGCNGGTLSLIYTPGLEKLRQACLHLESLAPQVLAQWQEMPAQYELNIQHYGRKDNIGSYYYFYDVQDWADNLASTIDGVDGLEVTEALDGCVLLHYNTKHFWSIDLKQSCCGLGMSIPQFWGLSKKEKLDAAYKRLQWQL